MTKVNNYKTTVDLEQVKNAINKYQSTQQKITAGMEMERFVLTEKGELPSPRLHDIFYKALVGKLGENTSVEPAAHEIEIKTAPHSSASEISNELLHNLHTLKQTAKEHGLKISDTSNKPHTDINMLRDNLVSMVDPITGLKRRGPAIINDCREKGINALVDYTVSTTSIQLTHSVKNAEQLYRWAKIHSALMPLYYAAFENRTRENNKHEAMLTRKSMGDRFLVADYLFQSEDSQDFTNRYIDFVTNSPLYSVLDEKGQDKPLSKITTFNQLPEEEKTLGNLLQAASFNWGVYKIKMIIDEDKLQHGELELSNMLLEVRDFDSSDNAISAIANWIYPLVADESNLDAMECYLEDFGIPVSSNPISALNIIREALDKVGLEENYLETKIGNEGKTLRNLVEEVIIPVSYSANLGEKNLENWIEIVKSQKPIFSAVTETKHKPTISSNLTAAMVI